MSGNRLSCVRLRQILGAHQEKPPLDMVEIDPVGEVLDGVLIDRITGSRGSRQEGLSIL